jgi:hypothetical protein
MELKQAIDKLYETVQIHEYDGLSLYEPEDDRIVCPECGYPLRGKLYNKCEKCGDPIQGEGLCYKCAL